MSESQEARKPARRRRRRKTDAPGADRGRSKPVAQLPAATSSAVRPKPQSTPARPTDTAPLYPAVDLPVAEPEVDLNRAMKGSPPTSPKPSASGLPAMPRPPRKSGAAVTQARLVAVGKRKAVVSPGDQPDKPSPPTQPTTPTLPPPIEDPTIGQPWTLQSGKLPSRYSSAGQDQHRGCPSALV
ncbi:ESX-1 secretion-associated protein EspI-like [Gigantopelta aegis]|uniref:ESX-1 secretion-associated protein EspI-like n=1 Tax=Gigantopelta aegis TaxID=1735272 RepID=UPI001B88BC58|nr:ESX-1 secretion-associated protein EspI-like [Gigantopelta aegis]